MTRCSHAAVAGLQGDVSDELVADDDGGDALRQLEQLAWSRNTITAAAGVCRGAMVATAQNDRTSANTKRHNTNAIKLPRTLRIGPR
jgi:hypothetical protein